MNRPVELQHLLEELKAEQPASRVTLQEESRLTVVVLESCATRYDFEGEEIGLLLASASTIDRLFAALDYPEDSYVETRSLALNEAICDELEIYTSVEEL